MTISRKRVGYIYSVQLGLDIVSVLNLGVHILCKLKLCFSFGSGLLGVWVQCDSLTLGSGKFCMSAPHHVPLCLYLSPDASLQSAAHSVSGVCSGKCGFLSLPGCLSSGVDFFQYFFPFHCSTYTLPSSTRDIDLCNLSLWHPGYEGSASPRATGVFFHDIAGKEV